MLPVASDRDLLRAFETTPGALFLGSGVSRHGPANLPTADEFKARLIGRLVDALQANEGERSELEQVASRARRMPFEAILEQLDDAFPGAAAQLLRGFRSGEPNGNHRNIADLLTGRAVAVVVTTNFDTLVEAAAGSRDLWVRRPQFRSGNTRKAPEYIKLHGSVADLDTRPETLRATVRRVGQGLPPRFSRRLSELLDGPILFAGYGGTDLDLLPVLRRKARPQHFWLSRTGRAPLAAILGERASVLQGDLGDPVSNPLAALSHAMLGHNWHVDAAGVPDHHAIDDWVDELSKAGRAFAVGVLLDYVKASQGARVAFEMAERQGYGDQEAIRLRIANAYADQGLYEQARLRLNSIRPKTAERRAWRDSQLAFCYRQIGDVRRAARTYRSALARADGLANSFWTTALERDMIAMQAARLASAPDSPSRRQEAKEALLELRTTVRTILASGDTRSLANAIRNRSRLRSAAGELRRAVTDGRRAIELFDLLNDDRGVCISARSTAETLIKLREPDHARALLLMALERAESSDDKLEPRRIRAMLNDLPPAPTRSVTSHTS